MYGYVCMVRYPWFLSHAVWFLLYLPQMSPRASDWKSHGETSTMSPTRIHTRRFIFPRILQSLSCPSWHFTMILSKPSSLTAIPSTSLAAGIGILPMSSSLTTFFLPVALRSLFLSGGCVGFGACLLSVYAMEACVCFAFSAISYNICS